jgi:hypothetical protein
LDLVENVRREESDIIGKYLTVEKPDEVGGIGCGSSKRIFSDIIKVIN